MSTFALIEYCVCFGSCFSKIKPIFFLVPHHHTEIVEKSDIFLNKCECVLKCSALHVLCGVV